MVDASVELRLVLLAQSGDPVAVEALLVAVEPALSRYVARLVGPLSAPDVLQDVFVKIWRNLTWLRQPELFRPWAYRIATRACYGHLKRERRQAERIDPGAAIDDVPAKSDASEELAGELDRLFEHVSLASRAVLLLHYGEDQSIEETAAILDINVGTAKSRLSYGLACLRAFVKQKGRSS
jgi:RNA polymerase sigma-70 factor, ECF subfamily